MNQRERNPIYEQAISLLYPKEVKKISSLIVAHLNGCAITEKELTETYRQVLKELEISERDLRKIDLGRLTEVKRQVYKKITKSKDKIILYSE